MKFRASISLTTFIVFSTIFNFSCTPAVDKEAVKTEVEIFLNKVMEDFKNNDIEIIKQNFSDDPDTVFLGPGAADRWLSLQAFIDHHIVYYSDPSFKYTELTMSDLVINVANSGDVAWFSCSINEAAEMQGQTLTITNGRYTGAVEKRNGRWVVVQHIFSLPTTSVSESHPAIEEANLKFEAAVQDGDASALAALYTEDATLMPPNSALLQGRDSIEAVWNAVITQMGMKEADLNTVKVIGVGDLVFEIGTFVLTFQSEGQEPVTDEGKYVVLWKMDTDGSWKLHVDIWNTSLPPQ